MEELGRETSVRVVARLPPTAGRGSTDESHVYIHDMPNMPNTMNPTATKWRGYTYVGTMHELCPYPAAKKHAHPNLYNHTYIREAAAACAGMQPKPVLLSA